MEEFGGMIIDTIFKFKSTSFDWMGLLEMVRSIPFAGFIQTILGWASPKNRL